MGALTFSFFEVSVVCAHWRLKLVGKTESRYWWQKFLTFSNRCSLMVKVMGSKMSKSKQIDCMMGIIVNISQTLDLITAALKDHQRRLVLIEGPRLEDELKELEKRVNLISDPEKRLQGLKCTQWHFRFVWNSQLGKY